MQEYLKFGKECVLYINMNYKEIVGNFIKKN